MAVLAVGLAAASDQTDVMVPIHQFVDGFNKGDAKSALAACADQVSIIDEFPPHEWHGAGACTAWMEDYETYAKTNGVTDGVVTLGQPWHIDVTGARAYVVAPATFSSKHNGKPSTETGAAFIFALQKGATGWRITGWAWGAK
jgi:hypothetical protein